VCIVLGKVSGGHYLPNAVEFAAFVTSWGLENSDELCKHVKTIIEARILYIVLLFAVKYKFMTLWLNTTINSSTLSGLLHLIQHLLNL